MHIPKAVFSLTTFGNTTFTDLEWIFFFLGGGYITCTFYTVMCYNITQYFQASVFFNSNILWATQGNPMTNEI